MRKNYNFFLAFAVALLAFGGLNAQQRAGQNKNASLIHAIKGSYTAPLHNVVPFPVLTSKIMPFNASLFSGPCDTIFYEDFQSQTIPASWGNVDADGLTDANGRPQNYYIIQDPETTLPNDTNYVAAVSSWFTPFAQASNYLIPDSFTVCDPNLFLVWKSAPFEGPGFADGYKVLISTTTNLASAFTDTLAVFSESVGGAATQTAGVQHTNYNAGRGVLTEWSYSLAGYAGQTIYIAFWHDSDDDNFLMLDDISVIKVPAYDMSVEEGNIQSEYFLTPLPQVMPYGFDGRIRNNGPINTTNPKLYVDVFDTLGNPVYSDSNGIGSIVGLTDTALSMGSTFTPGCIQFYETRFLTGADETDPDASNDTLVDFFGVTDSVYARDIGVIFGSSLGIGAGNSGLLGQQFTINTTATASSATFFLVNPTHGDSAYVRLYNMAAGTPNAQIATSALIILDSAQNLYTIPFTNSVILTPANYVLLVQESVSQNITIATTPFIFNLGKTWVFFNGSWSNNEDFNFFLSYVLRLNFSSPPCGTPNAGFSEVVSGTQVAFTDTTAGSICMRTWDFGDGNTSTMKNPTHTYATGGNYTICLITENNCGIDTVCKTLLVACQVPVAGFSETISGKTVTFTDNTTNGPTNWAWDFGDGNTSTMQNPVHTYASGGVYTVCLAITNACGSDSTCNTVTVVCNEPAAGFAQSTSGTSVTFTDQSTNSPTSWTWDFGDGGSSNLQNPAHNYGTNGTWTACVIATNICGADTFCQSVSICVAPTAAFSMSQTGDTVTFTDASTATGATYAWDFGDGGSSTMQNPVYIYTTVGNYTACLTVTDSCGTDSSCQSVTILVGLGDNAFSSLNVYPNPSTGQFNVEVEGINGQSIDLRVSNVIGEVLWSQTNQVSSALYQTKVNMEGQPAGVYFLTIESSNQRMVYKLMID